MADLRTIAALVDAGVGERVLVTGSLPDDASDLDLLVRPAAAAALSALLPAAGFTAWRDGSWMRIEGCLAAVVDLEAADGWLLPDEQLADLFVQSQPLTELTHVAAPAHHHALLIIARLLQQGEGRIGHRRLARARRAVLADPEAFTQAQRSAAAWGCVGALELLRAILEGRHLTRRDVALLLSRDTGRLVKPWRRVARALRPHRTRLGVVIAVSGLDGAGKTSQTVALADALSSLGFETVILWDRISHNRLLVRLAAPGKYALRRMTGPSPQAVRADSPDGCTQGSAAPVRPGSSNRATAMAGAWSLVVTAVHVLSAAPATWHHISRGRVVIRDRYVLDSLVHLRCRYGQPSWVDRDVSLLRWALPTPAAAYLLDVSAEEAYRRKPQEYDVAQLHRQREIYLASAGGQNVVVLDGSAPVEQLCERVVREVFELLSLRGGRSA